MSEDRSKERDTERLQFTTNEQNCLAMVCEIMSSIDYLVSTGTVPGETEVDQLIAIVEKFPNTNWNDLYDRFHRQGANS
jgi:hypothetical protein